MAKVLARPFEPTSLPEDKKSQPVRYFAAVGVVAVVLQAYVLTEWLVHGPTRTPNGPTPVPHSLDVSVVIVQGLCVGGLAAFFYFAVVRPLRRDHRLHWDGYLFFGFCLMAWGDPGGNMFRVWFTYPTNFVQFGSWLNYMPFVRLPHAGRFPEPLVSTYTGYVWYNFIGVLLGCKVMQKSRDRWGLGRSGQLWCGFLFLVCLDLIMEEICLRLNWYQYHETIGRALYTRRQGTVTGRARPRSAPNLDASKELGSTSGVGRIRKYLYSWLCASRQFRRPGWHTVLATSSEVIS